MNLKFFFYNCNFFVLLSCLQLCLFNCISGLFFILVQITIKRIHIFFQHFLCSFQTFSMQSRHFLKLVNLFSFVINEHLEKQGLPFFANKLMHGLIYFHSIFYCIFGCFDQAHFCLILFFVLLFFSQIIQLFYCDPLFFYSLFPDFHFLFLCFLFSLTLPLFFLHPENLCLISKILLRLRASRKDWLA